MSMQESTTQSLVTAHNVDLSNCDREQIQFAGAIQPHGALLVIQEPRLRILQVSANTRAILGLPPEQLQGHDLSVLLTTTQLQTLRERLARETLTGAPQHVLHVRLPDGPAGLHVFAHRSDGLLVLEWEVIACEPAAPMLDLYSELRSTVARLQATRSLQEFFDLAVRQIRTFTGFDRVMAYKFLEDGSGDVMAEALADGLEPYVGMRYPAVDIPAPARRLFSLTWLRHLPDVNYAPVPLSPVNNPLTGQPLDLSYSFLRSVSVMYSGYLKNMGVQSTMVMTLLKNGKLWGLISCMHHQAPKLVPYEVRMASEFLAHMVSLLMAAKEDVDSYEYRLRLTATHDHLVRRMAAEDSLPQALSGGEPHVLSSLNAHGAAIAIGDHLTLRGRTPAEEQVQPLLHWLQQQPEDVVATHQLAARYPAAAAFTDTASGLLAIRLGYHTPDFVLWFRPEVIQTVHWAGDPHKPVEVSEENGELRLRPRASFALWKETVQHTAAPWQDWEIAAAGDLRRAIIDVILRQAEELARINQELTRSNIELDAFAYVAAHDLKEPLRGINNYAQFLTEDYADKLDEEGRTHLAAMQRLTQRMETLLDSLLHFSRLGRVEFPVTETNLDDVVTRALEMVGARLQETGVEVRIQRPLGRARCNGERFTEVFSNLLTNAAKYNDKADKRIEVGSAHPDAYAGSRGSASVLHQPLASRLQSPVFYVRDNGIGIAAEQIPHIFQIFRRLHGHDAYGGGTGVGLTLVKRIIERHGGRIWVESTPGEGTTVFFTLAPEGGHPHGEAALAHSDRG